MILLPLLLVACGSPDDTAGFCTEIGCVDGYSLDLEHALPWSAGDWSFVLDLDGDIVTCGTTLPFDEHEPGGCDADDVMLVRSGTALPPAEQEVDGLEVGRVDLGTVIVTVFLDGVQVATETFTPVWETIQPNGPGCEPTCRVAGDSLAF